MAESAPASGPSLEQILWRAMDRLVEEPALLDSEEFAEHIEHAFDGHLPAEDFAERFFLGSDRLHEPPEAAEAAVHATRRRLHAYEFDLRRLEYVVVEDKDRVVVVSDFGQFALQGSDSVSRALEGAVVRRPERAGSEPRAYFVRRSGEVVGLDVKKLSRTLEQLIVRQVTLPAVDAPGRRLASFNPVRTALSPARETRALRQEPRLRQPPALTPARKEAAQGPSLPRPPAAARTALFLLMPDGSLARAEIGAANRWERMIGRAAAAEVARRVTVQTSNVAAVIEGAGRQPGSIGDRALLRADALAAVRSEAAPVRALGDDGLARAFASGARIVPALAHGDRFWVQPEKAFHAEVPASAPVVAQPLRLGEITGDPWADWALTGGAETMPLALSALRGRGRAPLRAQAEGGAEEPLVPPELAARIRGVTPRELHVAGAPVVAFRAPDGALILNRGAGSAIRLAAVDRLGSASVEKLLPLDALRPVEGLQVVVGSAAPVGSVMPAGSATPVGTLVPIAALTPATPIAARAGAVPFTALQTLQLAIERTASAGGYRLPLVRLDSAPDALEAGSALVLDPADDRLTTVRLAASPALAGTTARLLLSMPFPNQGELHVGSDLSDALQTYLAAPVVPASRAPGFVLQMRGALAAGAPEPAFDWSALHAQASQQAQTALITLDVPAMQVQPQLTGLPILLQKALAQGGDWTPGPGAPVPLAIRDFALAAPYAVPEGAVEMVAAPRPLRPGEDEIVIPMPLWAQMGRGASSETRQVMASPIAPAGYAPPLGVYRLVVPFAGPVDLTGGAPVGTPGVVDLAGPTTVSLRSYDGTVSASTGGGRQFLGRAPVADAQTVVGRRGRIRVGEPMRDVELATLATPALPAIPAGVEVAEAGSASMPAPLAGSPSLPARPAIGSGRPGALTANRELATAPEGSAGTSSPGSATASLAGSAVLPTVPARRLSSAQAGGLGGDDAALVAATAQLGFAASSAQAAARARFAGVAGEPLVAGLAPGLWSGHRAESTPGYQTWAYSFGYRDAAQTSGGVDLAGLSRPIYPELPTSLRFRYAGAPLWWSRSVDSGEDGGEQRSLREGLRAANSAATIWRSFLFAVPSGEDFTGGMDAGRDASADQMSSVRSLEGFAAAPVVVPPAGAAAAAGPAYIAMSPSGAAGALTPAAAARARAEAIEMSIVAAIPPAPPPLESMGSSSAGAGAPHARGKGHAQAHGQGGHKEADDAVSASKIEGSVDAIAQRIYHRIRRRIQSDRERFGG